MKQVDAELASGLLDPFGEDAEDGANEASRLPPGWQVCVCVCVCVHVRARVCVCDSLIIIAYLFGKKRWSPRPHCT